MPKKYWQFLQSHLLGIRRETLDGLVNRRYFLVGKARAFLEMTRAPFPIYWRDMFILQTNFINKSDFETSYPGGGNSKGTRPREQDGLVLPLRPFLLAPLLPLPWTAVRSAPIRQWSLRPPPRGPMSARRRPQLHLHRGRHSSQIPERRERGTALIHVGEGGKGRGSNDDNSFQVA